MARAVIAHTGYMPTKAKLTRAATPARSTAASRAQRYPRTRPTPTTTATAPSTMWNQARASRLTGSSWSARPPTSTSGRTSASRPVPTWTAPSMTIMIAPSSTQAAHTVAVLRSTPVYGALCAEPLSDMASLPLSAGAGHRVAETVQARPQCPQGGPDLAELGRVRRLLGLGDARRHLVGGRPHPLDLGRELRRGLGEQRLDVHLQ